MAWTVEYLGSDTNWCGSTLSSMYFISHSRACFSATLDYTRVNEIGRKPLSSLVGRGPLAWDNITCLPRWWDVPIPEVRVDQHA